MRKIVTTIILLSIQMSFGVEKLNLSEVLSIPDEKDVLRVIVLPGVGQMYDQEVHNWLGIGDLEEKQWKPLLISLTLKVDVSDIYTSELTGVLIFILKDKAAVTIPFKYNGLYATGIHINKENKSVGYTFPKDFHTMMKNSLLFFPKKGAVKMTYKSPAAPKKTKGK